MDRDEKDTDSNETIWEKAQPEYNEDYEQRGEPIANRESLVSEIFETNDRLERLKHRWRGDIEVKGVWRNKFEPMASDAFINKQISNAESVIDKINSFTKKDDKECKRILHDAVKTFILDCVDDESVKVENMRTMCKSFEHSIELFLGLVEFGHGATVLTDALAGLGYKQENQNKNRGGVAEWIKGKFNQ